MRTYAANGTLVLNCYKRLLLTGACGGTLDVSNGTITSPSFPQPYPPNKKCVWDIIAQPRHKITINFTHFEIEGNGVQPARYQRCEYDRIEIYSKLGDGRLSKHGNYCGNKGPSPITSESNAMRVVFTSDGTVGKSGFAAVFFSGKSFLFPAISLCSYERNI